MARNGKKRKLWSDEEKERGLAVYVQTGSLSAAARAVGAAPSTVTRWIAKQPPDEIEGERMKQRLAAVARAWEIATLYMDHLREPETIHKAGAKDSAIVAGTMIDKTQVLLGEPLRHEISGPNGGPIPLKLYDFDQSKYPDPQ